MAEKGLNGKFTKTAAPGSEERLHTLKIDELVAAYNALITKYNALLAKLDADAGVTDTDYASTLTGTSLKIAKSASDQLIPAPSKADL